MVCTHKAWEQQDSGPPSPTLSPLESNIIGLYNMVSDGQRALKRHVGMLLTGVRTVRRHERSSGPTEYHTKYNSEKAGP